MQRNVMLKRTRRGLRFVPVSDEELYAAPERVWEHMRPLPEDRHVAPVVPLTTDTAEDRDEG